MAVASLRELAGRGWKLLPIYEIGPDGNCTCPDGARCEHPGKHPRVAKGVNAATDNLAQLKAWRDRFQNPNWAVATGSASGVWVLDVDPDKGGLESLAQLRQSAEVPEQTLRASSGGGGLHYFFRTSPTTRIGNRVGFMPGLDVRGDGGYVLIDPSNHVSGGRYAWANWGARPVEAPMSLVASVSARRGVEWSSDGDSILDAISEGERNDTLFRMACSLRRTLKDDQPAIRLLVSEAGRRSGLSDAEIGLILDQAFKQDHSDEFDLSEIPFQRERRIRGGDFVFDEPETVPSVWGTGERVLWAEGEPFMIAGPQGLGKTTLAQQLVVSMIGLGPSTVLDIPVKQIEGRVIYLAMDRPRQAARSLRRMVGEQQREVLNQRLEIWRGPLPFAINDTTKAMRTAEWVAEEFEGIEVVVVDSVKDMASGLSKDEIGSALNSQWQGLVASGIEVMNLHHVRKAGAGSESEPTLDSVYGSTWLTAGHGSIAFLTGRQGEGVVVLHHVKQPSEVVGPLEIEHDYASGRSRVQASLTVEGFLHANPAMEWTAKQIAEELGMNTRTVERRLKALIDQDPPIVRVVRDRRPAATGRGTSAATFQAITFGG